jgi:hypothetical protein
MDTSLSLNFFQSGYVVAVPLAVFLLFILLYIPSMMVPDAKPTAVGQAITCYLMKTLGLLLMATSVFPLTYSLMAKSLPAESTVYSLLLVFVVGVGIITHFSRVCQHIDEASVVVVRSIFSHGFEMLGAVMVVFSALSLMLMFLLTGGFDAWEMPATVFLLGLLLMLMFSIHIGEKRRHAAKAVRRKR